MSQRKLKSPHSHSATLSYFFFALLLVGIPSPYLHAEAVATPNPATPVAEDSSNNVTLDFKEADINTVLRVMSLKSKVNIVAGPEVQGTITIRLENVPWEKALEVVLRTYGYVYEREGNIIRVTTRENLSTEDVVTQAFILNYTTAAEVQTAVEDMLSERGRIKTAERTNMVVITDIPTNLYRVGEVIKKLDKPTPQAFIDSKIIKTDVGATENLGIAWNPQGSLTGSARPTTFPFNQGFEDAQEDISPNIRQFFPLVTSGTTATSNPNDVRAFPQATLTTPSNSTFSFGTLSTSAFSATLLMLQNRNNTKVVSNPRIVVLNNQSAKVQVGDQIPLPTFERNETTGSLEVSGFTFRDVGVILNVTPHINANEEILVDLRPEVSTQGAMVTFTTSLAAPSFTVTQAITQVLIRSGETIAIGGLLTDNVTVAEARVPYLADVPFFGKLFRSKRQTAGSGNAKVETLFFVTVTVVDTEGQPTGERAEKKRSDANNASGLQNEKVATSNVAATPQSGSPQAASETAAPPVAQTLPVEPASSSQTLPAGV